LNLNAKNQKERAMANYTVQSFSGDNLLNVVSDTTILEESGLIDAGSGITVQFPAGRVPFTETSPDTYEGSFDGHQLKAKFSSISDNPTARLSIEIEPGNQPLHGHIGQVGTIVAVDPGNDPETPPRKR
jgi:hypothetical protein